MGCSSERQFKEKITRWKLKKNIDVQMASTMLKIKDKRKCTDDKPTEFQLYGIPVKETNLERWRKKPKVDLGGSDMGKFLIHFLIGKAIILTIIF